MWFISPLWHFCLPCLELSTFSVHPIGELTTVRRMTALGSASTSVTRPGATRTATVTTADGAAAALTAAAGVAAKSAPVTETASGTVTVRETAIARAAAHDLEALAAAEVSSPAAESRTAVQAMNLWYNKMHCVC